MRRFAVGMAAAVAVIGLFAGQALAGSAHLRNNVRPNPVFTDLILTLEATADYAGLGNYDTEQNLAATATPTADCVNPSGQHKPPGHNPAEVDVTGSTAVPASEIDNGNVQIKTTTDPPVTPIVPPVDCTNGQGDWTENITDMAFTSATLTVFQDSNEDGFFTADELVLTVSCTFDPPTANGLVPGDSYYPCTQTKA